MILHLHCCSGHQLCSLQAGGRGSCGQRGRKGETTRNGSLQRGAGGRCWWVGWRDLDLIKWSQPGAYAWQILTLHTFYYFYLTIMILFNSARLSDLTNSVPVLFLDRFCYRPWTRTTRFNWATTPDHVESLDLHITMALWPTGRKGLSRLQSSISAPLFQSLQHWGFGCSGEIKLPYSGRSGFIPWKLGRWLDGLKKV